MDGLYFAILVIGLAVVTIFMVKGKGHGPRF